MPEKIEIEVYTFDELEGEARERARNKVAEWNAEWENECLQDSFEDILEERGLPTEKLEWSLGYSQGDGVAFYGDMDLEKFLRHLKRWSAYRLLHSYGPNAHISRNSFGYHYSHYNTMNVDVECSYDDDPAWSEKHEAKLNELREEVLDAVQSVSHELEKMGYAAFEYASSEEVVSATCEANGYRFDERGNVV